MRSPAFIMEPHDGKPIHVIGDDIIVKVSSRDTDGAFTVFEGRIPPDQGPPMHMHHNEDETWRVLSGEFLFEVDGEEIYAGPGATVFAPRGIRHTFQNIGKTTGRLLTIAVPGGLDLFFEELEAAVPRGASIEPEKVAPISEKYRVELLGPPLAHRNATAAAGAD
jgi:mannose-6-phosphate isomerase-like protein (cupin superfamily)